MDTPPLAREGKIASELMGYSVRIVCWLGTRWLLEADNLYEGID